MIIYLHIGTPKSGTTYLQEVMGANRERLAVDGVLWPGDEWRDQVRAVRDFLDFRPNGVVNPAIVGWWPRVRDRILAWDGRAAMLSMEWLVHARPDQVRRITEELAPHELRVIVTARDIARSVPAQWQEQVQNWAVWTWEEYVAGVTAERPFDTEPGRQFWTDHDLGRMLRAWAEGGIPYERMTVVTVPGRSAAPDVLWQRFAQVIGVDPAAYDTNVDSTGNASLGAASAEVVRRVNVRTRARRLDWAYGGDLVVKWTLSKWTLGPRRPQEDAIKLPVDRREWAESESRRLIDDVTGLGVAVVGSLEDLVPEDSTYGTGPVPDAEQMLDAALDGLTGLALDLQGRIKAEMLAPPPPTLLQMLYRSRPLTPVRVVVQPVRAKVRQLREPR